MSEHAIAFRRGWQAESADGVMRPFALPARWDEWRGERPTRLIRRFQRPPKRADERAIWLEVESAPGVVAVVLNDAPLEPETIGGGRTRFRIDARLAPTNRLVLELANEARAFDISSGWGHIRLVIESDGGIVDAH